MKKDKRELLEILLDGVKTNIELDNLEKEFSTHCDVMDEIGDKLATVELARNKLKSELSDYIRAKEEKISEKKLDSLIEADDRYIDLTYLYHRLRNKFDVLKTRTKCLEKLADLWIGQYWKTDPKPPKSTGGKYEENVVKKKQDKLNKMLNKNKGE